MDRRAPQEMVDMGISRPGVESADSLSASEKSASLKSTGNDSPSKSLCSSSSTSTENDNSQQSHEMKVKCMKIFREALIRLVAHSIRNESKNRKVYLVLNQKLPCLIDKCKHSRGQGLGSVLLGLVRVASVLVVYPSWKFRYSWLL